MEKRYKVQLSEEEHTELKKIFSNRSVQIQRYKFAKILFLADISDNKEYMTDIEIAEKAGVSPSTVIRTRKKFVEGGLINIFRKVYAPRYTKRKLDGEGEAKLIAICCSEPPEGYARWSLKLLANKVIQDGIVDSISDETIRRTLKKTNLNPG